ncbi:MAG: secondary thiamine-phosphate synthase enzyme YjbQ [Gammaproteobacteria bacterium]|nr:secondary thiamine-phosphate synthase enzyme YjbQ [Gammaproteobacteria bacterium]MCF6361975.1 secondary thiamine-phosphate synthase enzyme YjbQ [Gammaproteobacteria bacterium]
MIAQKYFQLSTHGRGSTNITAEVERIVAASGIRTGLCHVFVEHTSASLMLCENADPSVRRDLEYFLAQLAPDGDPAYEHSMEGPDDMAAHLRTILTHSDLTIPVRDGCCALGTWQGVFLLEHRTHPHQRRITVTVQGE